MESRSLSVLSQRRRLPLRSRKCCSTTPDERYAPFPLTPIQHAYWLGRTHLIGYGGVACHVLFEWDKRHDEFDLAILEKAWNQLIARHDMLRMVVDADGQQRVLATTPEYHIQRDDLRALSPEEQRIALEKRRHELSYRVFACPTSGLSLSWWSAKSTIAITACI
ncbi:Phenyloxazoline synthase MbtB [Citrobacter koseri]|uniref:condensation domain-containing protein n=1 Tax=Citrobacter koseri TaxID=545 RepID=UPI000E171D43|nr:Phenyloxazoline synthase MbtB [Citrobacter koseri]